VSDCKDSENLKEGKGTKKKTALIKGRTGGGNLQSKKWNPSEKKVGHAGEEEEQERR